MSIATEITRIQTAKNNIKTAIEAKGGSVGDNIDSYAEAIENLPSGGTGGTDYKNVKGKIIGLGDIGWDEASIGYANANCNEYEDVVVTQANKDLYGVITASNVSSYKDNEDVEYFPYIDTSSVTSMYTYFSVFNILNTIPLIDTSNVTNMSAMFLDCLSLKSIPKIDTSNVTNMNNMLCGCKSLKSIPKIDTSNVTNMSYMFKFCKSLNSIPKLDTSNVTDMGYMFNECSVLNTIPQLDTSKVTRMSYMFYYCSSLKSIPELDTSNVTGMSNTFRNCSSLITIPQLDTSKVTEMNNMFYNCTKLQSINGIDFSSLISYPSSFFYNISTTLTHVIVNGSISFTWNDGYGFKRLTALDYDSIKSVLQAMGRCTNPDTAKTFAFSRTIADNNGELASLVADCATKGWTITGLTIQ